jgi:hypothetical protein
LPRLEIATFDITDVAEAKFWSHGIDKQQVLSVLDFRWIVLRNRRGRAAPFVVVGRDEQGRCLAIPIQPTHDRFVWRPVTAWYCKPSEAAKIR